MRSFQMGLSGQPCKGWYCLLLSLVLAFVYVPAANAGLLKMLKKAGEAAKKADAEFNLPVDKLPLPGQFKHFKAAAIKQNANGDWLVQMPEGHWLPHSQWRQGAAKNSVLILREFQLPRALKDFDALGDTPIFIRGQGNKLFQFKAADKTLVYGKLQLSVRHAKGLDNALWHLQRPIKPDRLAWFYPANSTRQGTVSGPQGLGVDQLMASMANTSSDYIVLAVKMQNGKLLNPQGQNLDLSQLQQLVASHNKELILLAGDKPRQLLAELYKTPGIHNRADLSTAYFLNTLLKPAQGGVDLKLQALGQGYTQLSFASKAEESTLPAWRLVGLVKLQLVRPNEQRGREIENEKNELEWYVYVLMSFVLGSVAIGTSYKLWFRLTPKPERHRFKWWLSYASLWLLSMIAFIALFLPLAGWFCFLYAVVYYSYKVVNIILIKPLVFIYSRLSRLITAA